MRIHQFFAAADNLLEKILRPP